MKRARHYERGTSSVEMVLALFWIVFVMVFLIGMGHTLINRQHALVGSRFAAFYMADTRQDPSPQMVSTAIASPEAWSLSPTLQNDSQGRTGGFGAIGMIGSALDSVLGFVSSRGTLVYTASTTPTRGLLPRMHTFNASASYTLANGTWTCEETGADYLSVLTRSIGLPGLPLSLAKCETYHER